MNINNKSLTGLINVNADNIFATSTIENCNANYFTGITSNIQDQLNSISGTNLGNLQKQITDNYNTEQNDKNALQTQIAALDAAETTMQAEITTLQTQVSTIETEITSINGQISIIDDNITTLQSKTQNQNASTTTTNFTNQLKVNNGVSDKVVLNEQTSGNNYFYNKSVFNNDINIQSGAKITSSTYGGQFNLGDTTNVGLMQIQTNTFTGTITLTAQTINLDAPYVNINGLIFSVNALLNDTGNFFSQF
jgi:hypothetical protein